jgi:hypothetical protein
MIFADLPEKIVEVQLLPPALVELLKSDLDFGPQLGQGIDSLRQFATQLLLRCLRQFRGLGNG